MAVASWAEIRQLFFELHQLSPKARTRRLDDACVDRPLLRSEIESLLAFHDAGEGDPPPIFRLLPPTDAACGEPALDTVGSYELLEVLGKGGMGTVFRARRADHAFEKEVAVKVIHRELTTPSLLRRFRRERQILAQLDHPGIARLLDGGLTEDGRPYFVMELVEGEAIDRFCDRMELGVAERVALFQQVLQAVQFAHRNLILHRDLKPENILVDSSGRARLLDFGIAEPLAENAADTRPAKGEPRPMTPYYSSPEQIRGEPLTTASDVYSLGVVLHRLLSGGSPYRAAAWPRALAEAILAKPPQPPSQALRETGRSPAAARRWRRALRGDLDRIVVKALEKEPNRRYPSAAELANDLRRHAEGLAVLAGPDTVLYRVSKFVRRHLVAVAASTLVVVTLLGLVIFLSAQQAALRQQTRRAEAVSEFVTNVIDKADPARNRGEQITVSEILDQARSEAESMRHDPATQASLLRVIGTAYLGLGRYGDATDLLLRARALLEEIGGDRHTLELAEIQGALGRVFYEQFELQQAEAAMQDALALLRRAGQVDTPAVAQQLRWLGATVQDLGRSDEAETIFEQARGILLGDEAHLEELAYLLRAQGNLELARDRYADAESSHRQAVELFQQAKGTRLDLSFPLFLIDLAQALRHLDRLDEAETEVREALGIQRRIHQQDHPYIATTLTYLGNLRFRQGAVEEAEQLYEQGLEIRLATLGESHPKVGNSYVNLANVAAARKQRRRAEELYHQALAILQENLPAARQDLVTALTNLGRLVADRPDEATQWLERALALARTVHNPRHRRVASVLHAMGQARFRQKRYREAAELFREAADILTAIPGARPRSVATYLSDLATTYYLIGDLDQAEKGYDRALSILYDIPGDADAETLKAERSLILVWFESGRHEKVEPLADSVLERCRGSEVGERVPAEVALARLVSIAHQGRLAEVREELEPAFQRVAEVVSPRARLIRIARRMLSELGGDAAD